MTALEIYICVDTRIYKRLVSIQLVLPNDHYKCSLIIQCKVYDPYNLHNCETDNNVWEMMLANPDYIYIYMSMKPRVSEEMNVFSTLYLQRYYMNVIMIVR